MISNCSARMIQSSKVYLENDDIYGAEVKLFMVTCPVTLEIVYLRTVALLAVVVRQHRVIVLVNTEVHNVASTIITFVV